MNVLEVTTGGAGCGGGGLTGGHVAAAAAAGGGGGAAGVGCDTGTTFTPADVTCSTTFDPAKHSSP